MEHISPEVYAKILDADLKNILKKAASGKTLSPAEHTRVVAKAAGCNDSVTTAKTVVELAALLGAGRRQITRWQKLEGAPPAAPNGSYDVVAWREFVRGRGLKAAKVASEVDVAALRARKTLAEIEDRELRVALKKGLYLLKAEVEGEWHRRMALLKNLLYAKMTLELPPLYVGHDAVDIQQINQNALDAVLREAASIE